MARRNKLLTVRTSEAEHRMLEALAEAEGVSASDLIRMFIRRTYKKRFGSLLSTNDD